MPRTPKQTDGATGPAKTKRPSTSKANGNGSHGNISSDEVARRAYEIYESRGGEHGSDFDDWLEAEKQVKTQSQPAAGTPPPADRRKRTRATSA